MYIFVSRLLEGSSDYSNLLKNSVVKESSIELNGKTINFRYNQEHKIIIVNGKNISASINNGFTAYLMADDNQSQQNNKSARDDEKKEENGKELVKQLRDIKTKIISESKIVELIDKPNYLFIHWGGANREKYSTRLRNGVKTVKNFPFEIIDFSSTDNIQFEKLGNKSVYDVLIMKDSSVCNWDNIEKASKILIDQSKLYSRRIYELMEGIYIKGFVNYERNKTLKLDDDSIVTDATWLIKNSKEVLTSLQSEEIEAVKGKITELYNQTENFKKFIVLNDKETSIEIKDLMDFRYKINELLNILPFPIYSRDL